MKVIIAPDKFKGSLSAVDAAQAIREGFGSVLKDAEIICCPIADGGEGTAEVLCRAFAGSWREARALDPLGREIAARFCWSEEEVDGPVAVLEMSEASGMRRLRKGELDSMRANTFGTGQLIRAATAMGARRVIVGLGGSATNDGGIGMAAALGYRFLDRDGNQLDAIPSNLRKIAGIEPPPAMELPEIIAAVDVRNPLLGPKGATMVFGPQKGAVGGQLKELEFGLTHLAEIVARDLGCDKREAEGAGAAGGLGFGLACFCGAAIRPGFDLVAEALDLEETVRGATLVITAEGTMDAQTLQGKGPSGVAALARRCGVPVVALAGAVTDEEELNQVFDVVVPIAPGPVDFDHALEHAAAHLVRAAARMARMIRLFEKH